ncbi:alkaline phosphatase family protein [Alcanivorax sp. ZXX171]|nr:alkaline phosphatase family protein [Alcanivorax sp. ZXX171]
MKVLVIGMDGVTFETFQRGWTPNISNLIKEGDRATFKEDLLSRGWSEIVTGKHALESGALYERPLMNAGYGWTEGFKLSDMPGLGYDIVPIWQALNKIGYKVGIMNIPTTFPAPKIEGFFVSGGGGGGPVSQTLSESQCYPRELAARLNDQGYILDERFGSLLTEKKLYEPADFFSRIEEMVTRRTQAFIELSESYKVDFGFLVYKSSTVGAESLLLPELKKAEIGCPTVNEELIQAGKNFYGVLDEQVKLLVDQNPGCQIILVSDHSTVCREAGVNLNYFLIDSGFQESSGAKKSIYKWVKGGKHLIPAWIKSAVKKSPALKQKYESLTTFDERKSLAFSMGVSNGRHGIYINDNDRFGGPVSKEHIPEMAENIAKAFNEYDEAKEIGARAKAKHVFQNSKEASQFPDVVIDLPDGFQTVFSSDKFIERYGLPKYRVTLHDVERDIRLTSKGSVPLAVSVGAKWTESKSGVNDLTNVYYTLIDSMD